MRRLVINDVGPRLDADAIARIGAYLGAPVSFATVDEAIASTTDGSSPATASMRTGL